MLHLFYVQCFIDQVSGYAYDNTKKGQKTNTDRSKKFILDYINAVSSKPYNADELVELLRNKLVHNYSVGDKRIPNHRHYALEYANSLCHLHEDKNKVYINIKAFIDDLEKAWLLYKERLLIDVTLQKMAFAHYNIYGILVHQQVEVKMP